VITKVEYGVVGDGIARHIEKRLQNPSEYVIIEYYTGADYKKKTIELASEPQLIRRFSQ